MAAPCRFRGLLVLAVAGACWSSSGWGQLAPEPATGRVERESLVAKRWMVVAAHPLAAAAGREILRRGGSAVDAAIATQLALNVVEPQSSGIGGGGFLLHYDAQSRKLRAYDGRETAPAAVSERLFLSADGDPLAFFQAVVGGRSVGVPGLVSLLAMAHARHGRLAWPALFEPAIALAERGFPVSDRLHALLARETYLPRDAAARATFYGESGEALSVGARLRNPELGQALREIASGGPGSFYSGELARAIVHAVRGHATNPGSLTGQDLDRYRSIERIPICGNYREWRVCGMPPPSSGGVTVLQILKLLESRDLAQVQPDSLMAVHLFSEAGRLAFADRNAYIADPGHVPVPVAALLDPGYLEARASLIDPRRSAGTQAAGTVRRRVGDARAIELPATTHLSVVDAEGNAVALTSSIENAFGARLMVRGFLLNNQLTDFSFVPERDSAKVANRPGPGKRPRSSMAPTMVFDRAGKLMLVLGSPGGEWIINYVARTLIAILDWGLDPQEAIAAPHYGSRNGPTEIERGVHVERLRAGLELLEHRVRVIDATSGLHVIQRASGVWRGAADPRREGVALGD